jgi:hypothetical protein
MATVLIIGGLVAVVIGLINSDRKRVTRNKD